jgi:hypothetical protein
MTNCLYQTDQFALISCQFEMALSKRPAEKGNGACPLMKNRTKACSRRIAIDQEGLLEVGKMKNERRRESPLQGVERRRSRRGPNKRILLEQRRQRGCEDTEALDEAAIVPSEAKGAPKAASGSGCGQVATASTLSPSMATPSPLMTWPR